MLLLAVTYGPFIIQEKIGRSAYKLKLPTSWKGIHPVFNEVLLQPYVPATFPAQPQQTRPIPPAPILLTLPAEILDSRIHCSGIQYLVRWHNKPQHESTWEKKSDLTCYNNLIQEFHASNPTAPKMPTITIASPT
jgi:hypothetical protein